MHGLGRPVVALVMSVTLKLIEAGRVMSTLSMAGQGADVNKNNPKARNTAPSKFMSLLRLDGVNTILIHLYFTSVNMIGFLCMSSRNIISVMLPRGCKSTCCALFARTNCLSSVSVNILTVCFPGSRL